MPSNAALKGLTEGIAKATTQSHYYGESPQRASILNQSQSQRQSSLTQSPIYGVLQGGSKLEYYISTECALADAE
eukprot:4560883-Pleurochrysis_carterae.AAC.1